MGLFLVRHGRPLPERGRPAAGWRLDARHLADIRALREGGRLPRDAAWYSSPEPKALQTARLLTAGPVEVVDDLREQVRGGAWIEEFGGAVGRAFADEAVAAYDGWEPLAVTRRRVADADERCSGGTRRRISCSSVMRPPGAWWSPSSPGRRRTSTWWRAMEMPDAIRP